jgi:hypothetical protein
MLLPCKEALIHSRIRQYLILQFNAAKEHSEILHEFPPVFRNRVNRYLFRPTLGTLSSTKPFTIAEVASRSDESKVSYSGLFEILEAFNDSID